MLIWVLVLNSTLLGVVGLWQRHKGTNRLLGRVTPSIHKNPEQQFGPYAYRSNAVQYFSMIWPLGLGLWAITGRTAPSGWERFARSTLLGASSAVGILPLMTRSRMGAMVGVGALSAATAILVFSNKRKGWRPRIKIAAYLMLVLAVGLVAGWSRISYRLHKGNYFGDPGRTVLRQAGWRMFRDNPAFGTGPGTFATLYQLYRPDPSALWYAQMHCDWLETLATYGIIGTGFIIGALSIVLIRWTSPTGVCVPGGFVALAWLSVGSCLLHAVMDFPFQIYSVLHVFVVICALIATLSLARVTSFEANGR